MMNLRKKAIVTAILFTILVFGGTLYFVADLQRSADKVVRTNTQLTEAVVHQLTVASTRLVDSLNRASFFAQQNFTRSEEKGVDALLAAITEAELTPYNGVEGGFYFQQLDQFFGYSFPTSPAPKPVFGPPPRSYNIIRDQTRESISGRKTLAQIHQFDPATFPLVTEPIIIRGEVVGCVWARIHIERLIPTFSLTTVLIIGGVLALVGFAVALGIAWNMRKHVEEISVGLATLHTDGTYRFPARRGAFGFITDSVNEMVEAREKLEHEMHQQDKMATLGTLVAGVAHEVKTPLAIIKTRIQMWERKLRERNSEVGKESVVSGDSMKLVIGEINRLSALVKRLLIFSKPVTNTLKPTNINQLIEQTVALIQADADEKHINMHIQLEVKLPLLNLDVQSMEQVFLNIFSNSLEAMPKGGTLSITSEHLVHEKTVRISIQDTGKGIPSEIVANVFNPFFTTKEHGAGLGLAISYEIIRAHNGKIEFIQPNNHGALCHMSFPLSTSTKKQIA